ncbi:MAG: O-antigen ligase family protein [Opitutaceae bacterium]|nr:O-antigen ligase family protein [Opitutaceae bacterium]
MTTPLTPFAQTWPARLLAAAAAGALVLTLAHPSGTRQFTWPWHPLLWLLWLAPVIALLADRTPWRQPGRGLAAGLLLLGAGTLASAALSPFAALSLPRVWPTVGGLALFFWLHGWIAAGDAPKKRSWLVAGLAGAAAVVTVVSLVHWRWQSAGFSWLVRNDAPFGHSNYTAGALLLGLPWLVHAAWQARGIRRLAWALAAVAAGAALLTTSSRAAVLALGGTGAVAVAYAVVRAPWPRRTKGLMVVVAGLLLAGAIAGNPRLRELARGGGWSDVARESNTQRSAMLAAGWQLGVARPLLGWGPGSVPLAYPQVRAALSGGVDNVLQLHNTPMQLWATLGGVGLAALALILASTLRRLLAIARAPEPAGLAAAFAMLAYGAFALTDHQLDLPYFTASLVVNLCLLGGAAAGRPPIGAWTRRTATWLVAAALLVPCAQTLRDLAARFAYEQALVALGENRLADAVTALERAAERAPYDPYYRHQLAGRLLAMRATSADATERERLATAAAEHLRLSLAAGCFTEFAHFNLAWLALESDAPRLAASHFRATLALAPHRGGAYLGLGLALRARQENAAAVRAFALEWINDPAAALSPQWAHPELAIFRPSVAREAGAILAELEPHHPTATYVSTLWRWWDEGGPLPATAPTREARDFVASLAALQQGRSLPPEFRAYAWGELLDTWQRSPSGLGALAPRDPDFAAVLARRAARHPAPDVHGFLAAGPEGEDNLVVAIRSVRSGYGVLALHPDGPVLADLAPKTRPRLVSAFASAVFPARGWLPARELLARLPAETSTP